MTHPFRFNIRTKTLALAAAAAFSVSFAGAAHATYTTVNAPPSGEKSVAQILGNVYGGTFTLQPATHNYANGSGVVATRLEDSTPGAAPTNLINTPTGDRNDQLWIDGIATGSAKARWAAYEQSFGYFDGWTGGSYHNLFDVAGTGYSVGGDATIDFGAVLGEPAEWRWARAGTGDTWTSLPTDNDPGDFDHMITFLISGLTDDYHADETTWMLFWEDLNLGDADYNDLAVEVIAHAKPVNQVDDPAVPEPVTATLGAMGAAALGLAMSRRKRKA